MCNEVQGQVSCQCNAKYMNNAAFINQFFCYKATTAGGTYTGVLLTKRVGAFVFEKCSIGDTCALPNSNENFITGRDFQYWGRCMCEYNVSYHIIFSLRNKLVFCSW